ncbi:MAG: hypothetical protein AB7O59_12680 [Pirellulales bacterium]
MGETTVLEAAWRKIENAPSVERLVDLLRQLTRDVAEGRLSEQDQSRLVRYAIDSHMETLNDDFATATAIVDDFVLPICFQSDSAGSGESANMRSSLAEWIDLGVTSDKTTLRDHVVSRLLAALKAEPSREILWTTGAVGYRSTEIVGLLLDLIKRDDDLGNSAVAVLAGLGPTDAVRARLVDIIKLRISGGVPRGLLFALQELASPGTVDVVLQALEQHANEEPSLNRHLLITILSKIAEQAPNDTKLQEQVWHAIREYRSETTASGEIAARCNTSATVGDYLAWLADLTASDQTRRYITYDRLSELVSPRQLDGWSERTSREVLAVMQADACRDTQYKARFASIEGRVKEAAWETALCVGVPDVLAWVDESFLFESNPYTQHSIGEVVSCLAVDELPPRIFEFVREVVDVGDESSYGEMFARVAAIRLTQSSGSRAAFEAVLDFGLTHQGAVLQSTSDALADLALNRMQVGDTDVVELLFERARPHCPRRHRDASIDAICELASNGRVGGVFAHQLWQIANDSELGSFSRGKAVEALGFLPTDAVTFVIPNLVDLAFKQTEEGWRALEVLARHHLLQKETELLTERMMLQEIESKWSLVGNDEVVGRQAFIVGQLYRSDPESFAPAVADVFRRASTDAVFQILQAAGHKGDATPTIVTDAVVERISARFGRAAVEVMLLDVLKRIDVHRLLSEQWEMRSHEWLPEGRIALCECIGEADIRTPEHRALSVAVLTGLALDSTFAVRRSAYRAISAFDGGALWKICEQWAESKSLSMRKRAAESLEWIPRAVASDEAIRSLRLQHDPERVVREATKRPLLDRWKREWATAYAAEVTSPVELRNDAVLSRYRFGRALTRLGDDSTSRTLRQHLEKGSLPSNVAHWIRGLVKRIERRWGQETSKWPTQWFGSTASIEHLTGKLGLEDGREFEAEFVLWRRSQYAPSDSAEWGGTARLPKQNPLALFNVDEAKLIVHGRTIAEALVGVVRSSPDSSFLVLYGSGEYLLPADVS